MEMYIVRTKQTIKECIEKKGQYVIGIEHGLDVKTLINDMLNSSEYGIFLITDNVQNAKDYSENLSTYHFKSFSDSGKSVECKIKQSMTFKNVVMTTYMFELLSIECKEELYKNRVLLLDKGVKFKKWINLEDLKIEIKRVADFEYLNSTKIDKVDFLKEVSAVIKDYEDFRDSQLNFKKKVELKKVSRKYHKRILKKINRLIDRCKSKQLISHLNDLKSFYTTFGLIHYSNKDKIDVVMLKDYLKDYTYPETCIVIDNMAYLNETYSDNGFNVILKHQPSDNELLTIRHINYNIGKSNFVNNPEKESFIDFLLDRYEYDLHISSKIITNYIEYKQPNSSLYYFDNIESNQDKQFEKILVLGIPRINAFSLVLEFFGRKENYEKLELMKSGNIVTDYMTLGGNRRFKYKELNNIMEFEIRKELIDTIYSLTKGNKNKKHIDIVYATGMYPNLLNQLKKDFKGCKTKNDNKIVALFNMELSKLNDVKTKYTGTNIGKVVEFMEVVENNTDRVKIGKNTGLTLRQLKRVFRSDVMKHYIEENFIELNTKPKKYIRVQTEYTPNRKRNERNELGKF